MDAAAIVLLNAIAIAVIIDCLLLKGELIRPVPRSKVPSEALPKVKVRYVIDGDTLIVTKFCIKIRIRLGAIDCPEDGQPWGNIATAGLIRMIGGRYVYVEKHGVDWYGRTVATLYIQHENLSGWTNVNAKMVMLGHAWVMRRFYLYLPEHRKAQLDQLEQWAQSRRIGLWKTRNPMPPWRWRRLHKSRSRSRWLHMKPRWTNFRMWRKRLFRFSNRYCVLTVLEICFKDSLSNCTVIM